MRKYIMIASIFQIQMRLFPDFIIFFMLPLVLILEVVVLKIGLVITKAEVHTSIRWVLISLGLQIGVILFIATPLTLLGFSGFYNSGSALPVIIGVSVITALFLDMNVLNVIHRLGFKKAIIVFALMLIPLFIAGGIVAYIMNTAQQIAQSQMAT